ncbi:MAG: hypothetical protein MI741_11740, partial [Rhodospirillales bacterium]|nr:hypothetical protein [Rhodospirillales bacterium]
YASWGYPRTGFVPGSYEVAFNTSPDKVPLAVERVMNVVERIKSGELPEADLARAKAKVLTNEFFRKQSNSDRAAAAALNELFGLSLTYDRQLLDKVEALTIDDIHRIAREYLRNPVVVVMSGEEIDVAAVRRQLPSDLPPIGD